MQDPFDRIDSAASRQGSEMAQDYWHNLSSSRLTRRRALAGSSGAALGAAFLAACGSGSSGGSSSNDKDTTKDKSGLVAEPQDTTSKAKAGGTIKTFYTADILHFDVLSSNSSSTVNDGTPFVYSRMVKFQTTKHP